MYCTECSWTVPKLKYASMLDKYGDIFFLLGIVAAISWPLILLQLGYAIDNPWNVCLRRAAEVGRHLAEVLLSRQQVCYCYIICYVCFVIVIQTTQKRLHTSMVCLQVTIELTCHTFYSVSVVNAISILLWKYGGKYQSSFFCAVPRDVLKSL